MEYVGGLSGAALGYIGGNFPGAVAGYKFGYTAGKNFSQKKTMEYGTKRRKVVTGKYVRAPSTRRKVNFKSPSVVFGSRNKWAGGVKRKRNGQARRKVKFQKKRVGKARYGGKFKKPRKIPRNIEGLCSAKGFHKTLEQFGKVNDPNNVILTHSTIQIQETIYTIATALIRFVMTKAGFKVTNKYNTLQASAGLSSYGIYFVYQSKNPETMAVTEVTYMIPGPGNNFDDIVDFGTGIGFDAFPNHLLNYVRTLSDLVPYRLAIYEVDNDGSDADVTFTFRMRAEIFLEDADLAVYQNSYLTIQNRTKAASAAAEDSAFDIDRIDNQPLKGYLYEFKQANPRVKHLGPSLSILNQSNYFFNGIHERGMSLVRGAEYEGAEEPFTPKYFSNIAKCVPVFLQPGEMKKTSVSYRFKGKMCSVMEKLRVKDWQANAVVTGAIGKSQMICLEEVMRTNSSNKIEIAYEREFKVGAIASYALTQAPLESTVVSAAYDNFVV